MFLETYENNIYIISLQKIFINIYNYILNSKISWWVLTTPIEFDKRNFAKEINEKSFNILSKELKIYFNLDDISVIYKFN